MLEPHGSKALLIQKLAGVDYSCRVVGLVYSDIRSILSSGALVLLGLELGARVEDLDVQLSGTLHNLFPLFGGDVVCNLCGIFAVLHQEHVKLLHVVHSELVEAIRKHVTGFLV